MFVHTCSCVLVRSASQNPTNKDQPSAKILAQQLKSDNSIYGGIANAGALTHPLSGPLEMNRTIFTAVPIVLLAGRRSCQSVFKPHQEAGVLASAVEPVSAVDTG